MLDRTIDEADERQDGIGRASAVQGTSGTLGYTSLYRR
jgi:hypothetical protein